MGFQDGGSHSLNTYLQEISKWKGLPTSEEIALSARIQKGDRKALTKLVQANLRFVINVAKAYQYQGVPLAELISVGNRGLITAAKRFDGAKNFKFISYAVWWIRQAILQEIAEQSRLVRVPVNKAGELFQVNKAYDRLRQRNSHEPSHEEVAMEMGINTKHLNTLLFLMRPPVSLDSERSEDSDQTIMDCLVSEDDSARYAEEDSLRERITDLLSCLNEREQKVVQMYFGFYGGVGSTLEEIASTLGITRERVRQIRNKAVERLKEYAYKKRANVAQW